MGNQEQRPGVTGESNEPVRPMSLANLLEAYGVSSDNVNLIAGNIFENISGSSPLAIFFRLTNIDPLSNFGQFVVARIYENVTTEKKMSVRQRLHRRPTRPDGILSADLQDLETRIRGVRRIIGEVIFKDKAEEFGDQVIRMITRGPVGEGASSRRKEWYKGFTDPIFKDFSHASEAGRKANP